MHLKRACALAGFLVLAVSSGDHAVAAADLQKSIRQCMNEGDTTPDERIKGCSVVLQYGRDNIGLYRNGYLNRAYAYLEKGDKKRALADLNKAIDLKTPHAHAFFTRGTIYVDLENWAAAIADLDEAIRIDPEMAEAYYNRAVAHAGNGDLTKAGEDRAKAFALKPELREG
jgi:tetratricopeptide (TPR) repeat protein